MICASRQSRGFVLVGVLLLMVGLVAMALTMTRSVTVDQAVVESRLVRQQLVYTAEAGMADAERSLNKNESCQNYSDIDADRFANQSYSVSIQPTQGSPVTLTASAVERNGATLVVAEQDVPVYAGSVTAQFTMGSNGRSAHIEGRSSKQDHNHGGDESQAISGLPDDEIRALFAFELDGLPFRARVSLAILRLHVTEDRGVDANVSLHRLTADWREDETTWAVSTGVFFFGNWNTAGGDFEREATAQFAIDAEGPVEVDITSLAQAWVDGAPNHGFLLRADLDANGDDQKIATGTNDVEAERPVLTIVYRCECGSDCAVVNDVSDNVLLSFDDDVKVATDEFARGDIFELNPNTASAVAKLMADGLITPNSRNIGGVSFRGDSTAYLAINGSSSIDGQSFDSGDMVRFDRQSGSVARIINRNEFSGANTVDAVHLQNDGTVLFSVANEGSFNGLYVYPDDIIAYTPGTSAVSRYLDGNTLSTGVDGDIDALHQFPSGRFAFSFAATATVAGVTVEPDQLLLYDATQGTASTLYTNDLVVAGSGATSLNLDAVDFNAGFDPAIGDTIGGSGGSGDTNFDCGVNYSDNFDSASFALNNGSANFTTPWNEIGESDGATSGDVRVFNDSGDPRLRIRDSDNGGEGVEREMDLSMGTQATLTLMSRRDRLDNSNDYVALSASGDGGVTWTEVDRYAGPDNDADYVNQSYDLSPYISNQTRIRFRSSSTNGGTDTVYIDNVNVVLSECL